MSGLLRRLAQVLPTTSRSTVRPTRMALVFQEYSRSLFPWMSVRQNVAFPLRSIMNPEEGSVLALAGDVVVRDAVITLNGGEPVIRSGIVESERIFDVDEDAVADLDGVALQKGRTRLEDGVLVLESNRLRIEDSCVRLTDQSPCSPESSRFLVGGELLAARPTARPTPSHGSGSSVTTGWSCVRRTRPRYHSSYRRS